jgi:hypothetical protein
MNAQHIMWMLLEAASFPSMWGQRAAVLVCIFNACRGVASKQQEGRERVLKKKLTTYSQNSLFVWRSLYFNCFILYNEGT